MHSGAGRRWGAPHIAAAGDVLCSRNNKSHHINIRPAAVSVFMGRAYSLFANSALRQPDDPSKLARLKRARVLFAAKLLSSRL